MPYNNKMLIVKTKVESINTQNLTMLADPHYMKFSVSDN